MSDAVLTIRTDAPLGQISPRLYGHFAEHLGRCCYDGLWVGPGRHDIEQHNGFRSDVLRALRALPVPLLRWPGGCYADHYHWRDGIGPADQRPIRLGMSCGLQVEDDNSLGTHEFLWFCRAIGAEPYLAGNVGSGSPQELCDWVEYCNTPLATTLGRLRVANGAPEPFGVRLWGVGNENWGCGGNYDALSYALEYRRYATMLRHVDPHLELVACGYDDRWNTTFMETLAGHLELMDHLSIHHYWTHGGPELSFNEEQYYALLAEAQETERFIQRTAEIIQAVTSTAQRPRRIGVALDEWGVWHPEARDWGPGDVPRRTPLTYEQANTLRDALAAAIALEGFHRQCQVLTLANLAQIVNVLQAVVMTDGPRMWLTPTYHAFRLHAPHMGATALQVAVEHSLSLPDGSPAVSATASRSAEHLTITLINRHYRHGASVRLHCPGGGQATGQLLSADDPRATNTPEQPEAVAPRALEVHADGTQGWRVELPPHSLATLQIRGAPAH